MLGIFIPTYGRVETQVTYKHIPACFLKYSWVVVSPTEAAEHKQLGRRVLECPIQGQGMAAVRQWILDYCITENITTCVMLDDDLVPQVRGEDGRVLGTSSEEEMIAGINWLRDKSKSYAQVGWAGRTQNWHTMDELQEVGRCIQVVAYNVPKVAAIGVKFNLSVPNWFFMEDFHMTLQLLSKGEANLVSNVYRFSAGGSNVEGGCSSQRTPQRQKEASFLLESLHPGIVKAVQKTTKAAWGGGVRWDVRVQWKKAYDLGCANKMCQ